MSKRKGVMLAKKMTPALLAKMPEQVYFQPKVNGMRCRAKKIDGKIWLFSSQGNVINSVPHINGALDRAIVGFPNLQLDGELYCHGMPVQDIGAICRKTTRLDKRYNEISFVIFDIISEHSQELRLKMLQELYLLEPAECLTKLESAYEYSHQMAVWFDSYISKGYEGLIIRDPSAFYKEGKASCLLKKKKMLTGTFPIVGAFQADAVKGVQVDMLGGILLVDVHGNRFKCGAGCHTHAERTQLWQAYITSEVSLITKLATIEYPELTKRGVPHMPVLKEIL